MSQPAKVKEQLKALAKITVKGATVGEARAAVAEARAIAENGEVSSDLRGAVVLRQRQLENVLSCERPADREEAVAQLAALPALYS